MNRCENSFFFSAPPKAVVVEELMLKLRDEGSAAAAALFAQAAVLAPPAFTSHYQRNKVITELLKHISLYFSLFVFILAFSSRPIIKLSPEDRLALY